IYARTIGARADTLRALAVCAIGAIVGLLGVTAHLAAPLKDMSPFVERAGAQAPGLPVYVLGDFDETIRGIVPFVTDRTAVSIGPDDLETMRPEVVLVQIKDHSRGPAPPSSYRLIDERRVGYRYLALWGRRPTPVSRADAPPGSGA